jgi:DNA recombination protein RmuC
MPLSVEPLVFFVAGLALGLALGLGFAWMRQRDLAALMAARTAETEALVTRLKESFAALSLNALQQSSAQFMNLAGSTLAKQTESGVKELEGKKQLIDQTLIALRADLEKVQGLMTSLEKDRQQKFSELAQHMKTTAERTERLHETTAQLKSALANTRVRGQWGERMAEDVLRLAGFVEGVNYRKQVTLLADGVTSRPDYTFLLPHGQQVNMDVKFPLDNYLAYLDAPEAEKPKLLNQFLRDARDRVKEATRRGYTDSNTLDYVLVFIPNEQVYAFLHEHDRALLDDAMQSKVVLCSPMTLYAILAVIRQAVDNFQLERQASEMQRHMASFRKQWEAFVEAMDKVEKKFQETHTAFTALVTTRRNQLERPLAKLDDLKTESADGPLPRLTALNEGKPL